MQEVSDKRDELDETVGLEAPAELEETEELDKTEKSGETERIYQDIPPPPAPPLKSSPEDRNQAPGGRCNLDFDMLAFISL